MGAADVVPGVSGGTIALITGVYERFIDALGSISPRFLGQLAKGRLRASATDVLAMHWEVLIPIALGIVLAVATMSGVITGLMESQPGPTYAFFFGLIAASAWVPFARMKQRDGRHAVALLLAALGAFLFVGARPLSPDLVVVRGDPASGAALYAGKARSTEVLAGVRDAAQQAGATPSVIAILDPHHMLDGLPADERAGVTIVETEDELLAWADSHPDALVLSEAHAPLWWLFICGGIAICAMILPGVSGSFLLLMLGQYHAVLSAISRTADRAKAVLGGEADQLAALSGATLTSDVLVLIIFNMGVLLGIVTFSRVVSMLLHRAHDVTMAALTGLMLGALRQPAEVMLGAGRQGGGWGAMIGALLAGAALVTTLNYLDRRLRATGALPKSD
jgi:putative membrane protein